MWLFPYILVFLVCTNIHVYTDDYGPIMQHKIHFIVIFKSRMCHKHSNNCSQHFTTGINLLLYWINRPDASVFICAWICKLNQLNSLFNWLKISTELSLQVNKTSYSSEANTSMPLLFSLNQHFIVGFSFLLRWNNSCLSYLIVFCNRAPKSMTF